MPKNLLEPVEPPADHECPDVHEGPVGATPRAEATAEARGWGPGWPADNARLMSVVRAGGIALSVRAELAPLVESLVVETANRGYQLHHGQCWGFANRPIRGTNRPSNHSWGLAVDLNSLANPIGPTLVTDMPPWMVELWTSKGFRWGGSYRARKDAMHFEYMGTPADVVAIIGAAAEPGVGAAPIAPAAQPLLREGAEGEHVRHLQERLNAHGARLTVDGVFGPVTAAAVRAFQQSRGLAVDAIVGPATWSALLV